MAECSYLARVDKFKVLEDGHKTSGVPLPMSIKGTSVAPMAFLCQSASMYCTSAWNVSSSMYCLVVVVMVLTFPSQSHSFPNIEIRLNLMVQYIIWVSLL